MSIPSNHILTSVTYFSGRSPSGSSPTYSSTTFLYTMSDPATIKSEDFGGRYRFWGRESGGLLKSRSKSGFHGFKSGFKYAVLATYLIFTALWISNRYRNVLLWEFVVRWVIRKTSHGLFVNATCLFSLLNKTIRDLDEHNQILGPWTVF